MIGNADFVVKSEKRGGLFADIIAEMDYRVGQILDAVKDAGVDDNTIFILSTDNAGGGRFTASRTRFKRAVARRFYEYAVRGKHAGLCNNPLAR